MISMSAKLPRPVPSARPLETANKLLPLEGCRLDVDARGGLARVKLVQRFTNPNAETLSVTYKLPLPADAAVSGFSFRIGERRISGVVEGKQQARDTFEQAILAGKSAALLEQDRSSLFTQEIGNIPAGETVEAEIEIDQPLGWLVEGCWEWRFPLAAAPRYLGSHAIEGDVSLDVATTELGARAALGMTIRDAIGEGRSPESPSHPLVCSRAVQSFAVELGSGNAVQLDRDLVVRWPAAEMSPGVSLDAARPSSSAVSRSAYGLLTVVPPKPQAGVVNVARDLTLLIDTSGSMSGEPLEQAKRVACALVDALTDRDQLDMVEFSSSPRSFRADSALASASLKQEAIAWIRGLRASGGTEMLSGVQHAMRALRDGSLRQIILITDGLVGFEREIVGTLLRQLPVSARLHALGVGSAVNRSLLAPIARAGGGIEAIVGLGEDPERAAQRLLARTVAPVLVDLRVEGSAVRGVLGMRGPDVFAASPLRVAVELAPEGGELVVRGRMASGEFVRRVSVPRLEPGDGSAAVVKLYARELVEDLEMQVANGETSADQAIERTGIDFAISTRLTSWVAVTDTPTVDPRQPSRRQVQPQSLPHGMSAEGLGLRQAAFAPAQQYGLAPQMVGAPSRSRGYSPMLGMGGGSPMPPPGGSAPAPGRMAPPPPMARPAPPAANAPPSAQFPREPAHDAPAGRAEEAKAESAAAPRDERRQAEREAPRDGRPTGAPPPRMAPTPAPMPAKAKKQSLLGRMKSAVRDAFAPEADDELARGSGTSTLEARIVRCDGDRVYVELVVPDGGLELDLEGAVVIFRLADGSSIRGSVIVQESTHQGSYGPGVIVRIVSLAGSPLPSTPAAVVIELTKTGRVIEAY